MKRKRLRMFRLSQELSQEKMADRIGVSRSVYTSVEAGRRAGSQEFWYKMQRAFNLTGEDMWRLMYDEQAMSQEQAIKRCDCEIR